MNIGIVAAIWLFGLPILAYVGHELWKEWGKYFEEQHRANLGRINNLDSEAHTFPQGNSAVRYPSPFNSALTATPGITRNQFRTQVEEYRIRRALDDVALDRNTLRQEEVGLRNRLSGSLSRDSEAARDFIQDLLINLATRVTNLDEQEADLHRQLFNLAGGPQVREINDGPVGTSPEIEDEMRANRPTHTAERLALLEQQLSGQQDRMLRNALTGSAAFGMSGAALRTPHPATRAVYPMVSAFDSFTEQGIGRTDNLPPHTQDPQVSGGMLTEEADRLDPNDPNSWEAHPRIETF